MEMTINEEPALSQKDMEAMRDVLQTYERTCLTGNWDEWGTVIARDAIFCPPNHEPVEGRDAIVAWARTLPKLITFNITAIEISGYNDLAYVYGKYSFTVPLDNGSLFTDIGSHIDILRKQGDGSWLYSRTIFRSDLPLPGSAVQD